MTVHNILNIYGTNAFENGIGIQTAMFNHSCNSNAEAVWVEDSQTSTGKSFSEGLILASVNPQYDKRLFIDLPVQ